MPLEVYAWVVTASSMPKWLLKIEFGTITEIIHNYSSLVKKFWSRCSAVQTGGKLIENDTNSDTSLEFNPVINRKKNMN